MEMLRYDTIRSNGGEGTKDCTDEEKANLEVEVEVEVEKSNVVIRKAKMRDNSLT